MSKTTPVRWWRDDADRYNSRPPYRAPEPELGPQWALDLIGPSPMASNVLLQGHRRLIGAVSGILRDIPDPWGTLAFREGRSVADPIADIKAFLADQRREIERINRSKS